MAGFNIERTIEIGWFDPDADAPGEETEEQMMAEGIEQAVSRIRCGFTSGKLTFENGKVYYEGWWKYNF